MPFKNIAPQESYMKYILSLFQEVDSLALQQIIAKSKLTKTQTLSALDALMESKLLARDEIKNIFYLL